MSGAPSGPLVVAFSPHPDDETYAMAGTLAHLAARGWRARVVYLTRGEAGVDERGPNPDLGATREAEARAACGVLGATPTFVGLPDGDVASHPTDVAPYAEGARLVLTLGEDGAYGHPDHLATTRMVAAAKLPATVLFAAFPKGLFAPIHRRLARFVALERGVDELGTERADHVVDVRPYRALKLAALAAHVSQLRGGDPRRFLVDGWIEGLLDEERWTHASGPDFAFPP